MASAPPTKAATPAPRRRALRLPPRRKLAALLGVWAVLVAAALVVANGLDDPVGSGALDPSQPIVAGVVANPNLNAGRTPTTAQSALPPLSLVLDQPFPDDIRDLPAEEQAATLGQRAQTEDTAVAWVRYGVAAQGVGDSRTADSAYRRAQLLDPRSLEARLGLLMVEAASSEQGLTSARQAVDELAGQQPRSQLIAFNQGWLAVYARNGDAAIAAWSRAARIAPNTFLGGAAAELVQRIGSSEPTTTP